MGLCEDAIQKAKVFLIFFLKDERDIRGARRKMALQLKR